MSDSCAPENWHAAANLFPLVEREELEVLSGDIKANGLNNSIALLDGLVLDGRNRALTCKLAGVEPAVYEWQGTCPVRWDHSQNAKRVNLTKSQTALLAVECHALIEELSAEAQARQRAGIMELVSQGRTRDMVGKMFGGSGRYLSRAKTVLGMEPEMVDLVRMGAVTLTASALNAFGAHSASDWMYQVVHIVSSIDALWFFLARRGSVGI